VLHQSAIPLWVLGRVAEALPVLRLLVTRSIQAKNWFFASVDASNLSQAALVAGDISLAVSSAQTAVAHAATCQDELRAISAIVDSADAQHAAGYLERTAELFAEAAERQMKGKIESQIGFESVLLNRANGNRYCDFLLSEGAYARALEHATQTIVISSRNKWLLIIAHDTLIIGQAHFGLAFEWRSKGSTMNARIETSAAFQRLNDAVDGLYAAGQVYDIPRGLLARAVFRRCIGELDGASRDLDEVEEISEPGPMKLYLCDMALERARVALAHAEAFAPLNGLIEDGPPTPVLPSNAEIARLKQEAARQVTIAADYIRTCEYHRRDGALAELQAVLRGERKFADLPPRV
jgi:tetratricopeptide (TPR) repeat protein